MSGQYLWRCPVATVSHHTASASGGTGQLGHAGELQGEAQEGTDDQVVLVLGGQLGAQHLGEGFVEAGEQHPFTVEPRLLRPGQGEAGLAGARSPAHDDPTVLGEGLEHGDLGVAELHEPRPGGDHPGVGVPGEVGVGAEVVDDRLHLLTVEWVGLAAGQGELLDGVVGLVAGRGP